MQTTNTIKQKLNNFSRKYYTNELIKGIILFFTLGLLYFIFTLFIEYFLWLKPTSRTILFWIFIAVELFLLIRFIGFPLFKLFGLQKGISQEESSRIIGNHFPEVKDKLLNVLQLEKNNEQSDLLLASIQQKTNELQPIPFQKAINFKGNIKYLKYALIPVLIWLCTLIFGQTKALNDSLNRVVNHQIAYTPPSPFSLNITDKNLKVIQGNPITIYVEAKGEVIPEQAKINYNNEQYFLNSEGNGLFTYTFDEVNEKTNFYIEANGITSADYQIDIIKTPTIQNVSMELFYPKYLKKRSERITNTGNVTVPEGTTIKWNIKTNQSDSVSFINDNKKFYFNKNDDNKFSFSKRIKDNLSYQIATSNQNLSDYEKLQYAIDVIKDEHPQISVKSNIDSISRGTAYFAGQISDDNGINRLDLVYYDIENPQNEQKKAIDINNENVQTFFYEFPKGINLQKGVNYEMYFQVFDNDVVNGLKKATSRKFSYRQKTDTELKEELLQEQKQHIDNLQNSLEKQQLSKKELEKIQFDLQNKKNLNWNDQKKIQNLVKRQERYKQMMQQQTEQLEENFTEKKEQNKSLQEQKENIKKRIEETKNLEKQQKLLDELMKMAEKLNKEELMKKTKQLAEQNKQQEKSLERVLEMTKRFYVQQKMTQIADKLSELAKKQEELAKKGASKEEQEQLKKEFEELKKEMKDLEKENEKLKEPMSLPSVEELKRDTQKQLDGAKQDLEQGKQESAKKKQQKSAKNMQQMSKQMQQQMQSESMEMQEENMEDMRYLLENLLTFSFEQESLMDIFSKTDASHPDFGKNLREQNKLKSYFEHIDDSLFVISVRNPKISSDIQDQLATAHYNLNESLENFAESRFSNGTKNQRYVMTAANELADMLSNTLDAMKNPKSGSGQGKGKKGKGESFSLPDIIQQQQDLMQKMQQGMQQQGKSGQQQKGENGKPKNGQGQQQGQNGQNGQNGEQMDGELYQIYKEQAKLRQLLKDAINNGGNNSGKAKKALQEMEQLENQILEKGFNQGTIERMRKLNYELLKLDKATFEQGKDNKRKSETNTQEFGKNNAKAIEFKKKYFNQTEILNRQALPLKQEYKKKVQEYFTNEKANK